MNKPKCKYCGETKLSRFYTSSSCCKLCQNNKRKKLINTGDYRAKQFARKYNITIDLVKKIKNGTNCEICNKYIKDRIACIDHCHETGKFRGALCPGCNTALGHIERAGIEGFIDYLNKHSNQMLIK